MTAENDIALHTDSNGLAAGEVIRLYAAVGWGDEATYDHERIRAALENTTFIVHTSSWPPLHILLVIMAGDEGLS